MRRVVPVLLALSVIAAACGQKSGVAGTAARAMAAQPRWYRHR